MFAQRVGLVLALAVIALGIVVLGITRRCEDGGPALERTSGPVSPTARRAAAFLGTAAVTAGCVLLAGWFTGLQAVMGGALVSLVVAAFLPFVAIGMGLLLLAAIPLILAVSILVGGEPDLGATDGAGALLHAGAGGLSRYYAFLRRQRHPVFWGVPCGLVVGVVVLWALIAWVVLPGEARTADVLAALQERLEVVRDETGRFPAPDTEGRLARADVPGLGRGDGETRVWVTDGFGRPLVYEASGSRLFASYAATSLGFDGKPGRDDLCVSGSTRLARWAGTVASGLGGSERAEPLTSRLDRVRSLRCPPEE